MSTINSFSQFQIETTTNFTGKSLSIDDILNQQIIVHDFKIGPSTKKEGTECLTLQIEYQGRKHVYFSGSKNLMHVIKQVPRNKFPFNTTIKKDDKTLIFT